MEPLTRDAVVDDDAIARAFQFAMSRAVAWDIYAASALGMSMHPGTTRDRAQPRSMEEISALADQLLAERDKRAF